MADFYEVLNEDGTTELVPVESTQLQPADNGARSIPTIVIRPNDYPREEIGMLGQVETPAQEIGMLGQVGYPIYAGLKGATFGFLDEALSPFNTSIESGYQEYARQNPTLSAAAETVGGLAAALTPMGAAARLPAGAARAAELLMAANRIGGPGIRGNIIQGALSGAGAAEGGLLDRFKGSAIGGLLGLGGGFVGQKLGSMAGEAKAMGRAGLEAVTPEEQAFARLMLAENPEASKPGFLQQAQRALAKTPELTAAEATGMESQLIRAAKEGTGGQIQEQMQKRAQQRTSRLKKAVGEATGITGKERPVELATAAKEGAEKAYGIAIKRKNVAGDIMYEELPWQKAMTLESIDKLEQQAKTARQSFEANVSRRKEFGPEWLEKYKNQTNTAAKTRMRKRLETAGIKSEKRVTDLEEKVGATRGVKRQLQELRKASDSPIAKQAAQGAGASRSGGPKLPEERNLYDYKEIRSRLQADVRDKRKKVPRTDLSGYDLIKLKEAERDVNTALKKAVPGLKKADWRYKFEVIPEAFGGMSDLAQKTVERLSKASPENARQFGQIILKQDPKILKEILDGAEKIGATDLKAAMKAGIKAMIDEGLETTTRDPLRQVFEKGTRSKQVAKMLFGRKELQRLVEKTAIEKGMSKVEANVLGNSITGGIAMAERKAVEAQSTGFLKAASKILRVPVNGPKSFLNLVGSFLANETVDPMIKRDMDKILGMQGKTAAEKIGLIGPYLEQLGRSNKTAKKWQEIGGLIGQRGLSALVQ